MTLKILTPTTKSHYAYTSRDISIQNYDHPNNKTSK